MTKVCRKCKKALEITQNFYKHPSHKDGYRTMCKTCMISENYGRIKLDMKRHYQVTRRNWIKRQQSTPDWVDLKEIYAIYKKCPKGYEVDHIIPVNNKNVCGLTVPWNLQYLPSELNLKKNNRFDGTYDNSDW